MPWPLAQLLIFPHSHFFMQPRLNLNVYGRQSTIVSKHGPIAYEHVSLGSRNGDVCLSPPPPPPFSYRHTLTTYTQTHYMQTHRTQTHTYTPSSSHHTSPNCSSKVLWITGICTTRQMLSCHKQMRADSARKMGGSDCVALVIIRLLSVGCCDCVLYFHCY